MSHLKRPSHSTVAAYLALFIALGGGSFAVAALNKKDKKTVKNIANTEITKRAPYWRCWRSPPPAPAHAL